MPPFSLEYTITANCVFAYNSQVCGRASSYNNIMIVFIGIGKTSFNIKFQNLLRFHVGSQFTLPITNKLTQYIYDL